MLIIKLRERAGSFVAALPNMIRLSLRLDAVMLGFANRQNVAWNAVARLAHCRSLKAFVFGEMNAVDH